VKILFLCTDNYTRSVTAEFCLKHFLKKNKLTGFEVSSAGFKATSVLSKFSSTHFDRMHELGIETSTFERTQFKQEFLDEFSVIVGMGKEHKDYILEHFNKEIFLFNELYLNEQKSVVVPPPDAEGKYLEEIKNMVDYINHAMPIFVEQLPKMGSDGTIVKR
jgi:protein-tyrosine phosphatase